MKDKWLKGKLGDVAQIIMGQSPPGETCNQTGIGTPLLNGPTEFGSSHPFPIQFTTDPKKISEKHDILFCVRGSTTGRMNWADQRYAIGRGIAAIRPKFGCKNKHFVKAVIDLSLQKLLQVATGSTFPNVSKDQLQEIECLIPSLEAQSKISQILGSLHDKIELNCQMNVTLEAMARALFQSWFVDFDPVRAKLDGRKPAGMDDETAALFPSEFQDSELGSIPKGWEVKRWGDISTLEYGKSLRDYRSGNGKYQVFGTNGPIGYYESSICDGPGIVIGRKGAYRGVHFSRDPFFVIDTAFYLKSKAQIDMRWAYYELLRFDINSLDSGSAIPSTSRDDFYGITLVFPPVKIQEAFGRYAEPWFAKIDNNENQSKALCGIRDTLLPKLLNGEIRI